jgi:HlyD family secretion protein
MEGQTLARISPLVAPLLNPQAREEARARLQAAEASQEQALATLRRGEVAREHAAHDLEQAGMLTKTGSASADTLDHARLEVQLRSEEVTSATFAFKVAVAQVAAAKAALERYDRGRTSSDFLLKAPISGQVLRVFQESGGVLPAGTNLLEMGDLESLEVVTDALTTDAVHMEPGQRVVLDGWGKEAILGHVRQVEPSAFTRLSALGVEEQRVKVLLDIDSPRDAWAPLGDGFRVETHVVLWSSPTAPSLPWSALFRHQEAWAVYRVENHRAWLTPVTVGHRGEDRVELLGGLSEDATVVLHPGDRIRHGVRVREEKPDSP